MEGLTRVEMDCRDGSLLLEYDTSRLGHADVFLLSLRLEALVRQGQVLQHGGLLALRGGASPPERALPACSSVRAFRGVPCLRRLRASGGVRALCGGSFLRSWSARRAERLLPRPARFRRCACRRPDVRRGFPGGKQSGASGRSAGTSPRHDLHFSGRSRAELRGRRHRPLPSSASPATLKGLFRVLRGGKQKEEAWRWSFPIVGTGIP